LREIKIFAGRFSTSVARQVFHQLFRFSDRFRDSIAHQPNLWPEIQISADTIDLPAAKQIPFVRWRIVSGIQIFSAASTKESVEISNFGRIFFTVGRRTKDLLKIAFFCGIAGVCRRHFGPVAGNPNRQPEIQKNRWKSAEVPELFCSCGKFQTFS
jgi:hypothetical protein